MVQLGTPEQYFGSTQQIVVAKPVEARIMEPVEVKYVYAQNGVQPTADYTPLIIGVCFLGTVCFLAFLAWMWKK